MKIILFLKIICGGNAFRKKIIFGVKINNDARISFKTAGKRFERITETTLVMQ